MSPFILTQFMFFYAFVQFLYLRFDDSEKDKLFQLLQLYEVYPAHCHKSTLHGSTWKSRGTVLFS